MRSITNLLLQALMYTFPWNCTYPVQSSKIVTFPSNHTSCNSYSLIVLQNYLEILAVLTQGFPLMRSNMFQKFPLLTVSQIINCFCFLNIYSKENSFLFGSPSYFEVCQSSFGLAIFCDCLKTFKNVFFEVLKSSINE